MNIIRRDHSTVIEEEAADVEQRGFFLPRPSWSPAGLEVIAPQEETAGEPPPTETMLAEMTVCLSVDDVRRRDPPSNEDVNLSLSSSSQTMVTLSLARDHDPTAVGRDSEEEFIKSQCKKALRQLSSLSSFFNNDDPSAPASEQWNGSETIAQSEKYSLQDEGTFNEMAFVVHAYHFAMGKMF